MTRDSLWISAIDHRVSAAVVFFMLLMLLNVPARRRRFALKALASFAVMCAASWLVRYCADVIFTEIHLRGIGYSLQMLILPVLFTASYLWCYSVSPVEAVFTGTLALTIFKVAWNAFKTGDSLLLLHGTALAWGAASPLGSLISYVVYFVICLGCALIYRRLVESHELHSPMRQVAGLACIFLLCQMLLEYCGHVFTGSHPALFLYYFCALLYTILNFAALLMIAMLDSFRHENRNMHDFISNKMRYYQMSHDGIVALQTKCHDLKHQISAMRSEAGKASFDKYLNELETSIDEYSTVIECGHPAIDIVLTEKNILCATAGVKFSYMIDGTLFAFLTDREIYSLFGNAMDNALEAAERVADPANRMISLKSNVRGGLAVLQIENTYEGERDLSGDLPLTTKRDSGHGFGLRSIRRIAEKHGGGMALRAEDGIFKLSVFMKMAA